MTESAIPAPDPRREARRRFRRVAVTLLQAVASTAALVVLYYVLPLDQASIGVAIAMLSVGLSALVGLVILQVRAIIKAPYPPLRAVGALATSAPLFLLLYAGTYFVIGRLSVGSFSEQMTRTDSLYFTVTVFATVGFGDITATSQAARALVTGQMVLGILIVGLGAKIIVDAVKQGMQRRSTEAGNTPPTD